MKLMTNPCTPNSVRSFDRIQATLVMLACLVISLNANAALLFYEDFNYTGGLKLGSPAGTPTWENAKDQFTIGEGSLNHVGIQASTGNRVIAAPTTLNIEGVRTSTGAWTAQSSGVLYVSFLMRVVSTVNIGTTGDGTPVLTIGRTSNSSQMAGVSLLDNGGIKLGAVKYPGGKTPSSSAFFAAGIGADLGSSTVLVILKYEYVAGTTNDIVTVWVNPDNVGATEDPANKVTASAGTDGTYALGRLELCRGLNVSIDEIRIGQTWAEVTPTGGPLVASQISFGSLQQVSFVGTTLQPVVVNVLNPGGVLVPTNGVPVTLSLTAGSGNLNGTLTQYTGPDGRAVFNDLSFDTLGNGKEIRAASTSLGTATRGNLYVVNNPNGGGLASAPVITQAMASAGGIILRGKGGAPNGQFELLSAQNAGSPANSWGTLAVSTFDAQGNFAMTNPITPGETHRFYRLRGEGGSTGSGMFQHMGYASVPAPITGGGDTSDIVVVTNLDGFMSAVSGPEPRIVYVEGTITLRTNGNTYLYGNKTIIGLGTDATLIGCLGIFYNEGSTTYAATNIIIRNLTITNPDGYGENDAITIKNGGRHVWIDHCTFYDTDDGLVDATRESDFITISWCKFYYTSANGHENVNLIGGDDGDSSDAGKLHLTLHHNWYGDNAVERMPSVRYGRVHFFNNYVGSSGNNYCTRTRLNAEVLVENNHYENVQNPWEQIITSGTPGLLRATGNITNNCNFTTAYAHNTGGTLVLIDGSDILTDSGTDPIGLNPAPYAYTLDDAVDVQTLVTTHAGAGNGPFAP